VIRTCATISPRPASRSTIQTHTDSAHSRSVSPAIVADPHRATDLTHFRVRDACSSRCGESLGAFDLSADLAEIRCPAVIVHGRQDPIPIASSEAIAKGDECDARAAG